MTSFRTGRVVASILLAVLGVAAGGCGKLQKGNKAKGVGTGEDLYARGMAELEQHRLTKAKAALDAIQFTAESRSALEPLVRLAFADILFYTGDGIALIDARSKYVEFVTLYGDHPRAGYAQFQAGICSLKQISSPARDQSQTRAAVADLTEVERRYADTPYAAAARSVMDSAEASLAEHEFVVGQFYAKRKAYFSAAERFRGILERYPQFAGKQKVYLELGRVLIGANNRVEGSIYLDKLVADYPGDSLAAEARKLLAAGPVGGGGGAKTDEPRTGS
jgi:outer membrane protein assembly factor BamD